MIDTPVAGKPLLTCDRAAAASDRLEPFRPEAPLALPLALPFAEAAVAPLPDPPADPPPPEACAPLQVQLPGLPAGASGSQYWLTPALEQAAIATAGTANSAATTTRHAKVERIM